MNGMRGSTLAIQHEFDWREDLSETSRGRDEAQGGSVGIGAPHVAFTARAAHTRLVRWSRAPGHRWEGRTATCQTWGLGIWGRKVSLQSV